MNAKLRTVAGLDPNGFNELQMCSDGPMVYNRYDEYVGRSLQVYGDFSVAEGELFRRLVRPGAVVVEVGANIGAHTVALSRMTGPEGEVHAFEPQRIVFQTLCANLALNQCMNVFAHQAGVGAASGSIVVPPTDPATPTNFGGISLRAGGAGERVPLVTLDELGLRACHFLKADVEGMEFDVLKGGEQMIYQFRPVMFVENDREERSEALLQLIMDLGYVAYWHVAPLFNPANFAQKSENIFAVLASVNLLCVPEEASSRVEGLRQVQSPRETWRNAVAK